MDALTRRVAEHLARPAGSPAEAARARVLLREVLMAAVHRHPLTPTGDAHRDRLVAARLNLRSEA